MRYRRLPAAIHPNSRQSRSLARSLRPRLGRKLDSFALHSGGLFALINHQLSARNMDRARLAFIELFACAQGRHTFCKPKRASRVAMNGQREEQAGDKSRAAQINRLAAESKLAAKSIGLNGRPQLRVVSGQLVAWSFARNSIKKATMTADPCGLLCAGRALLLPSCAGLARACSSQL